MSNWIPVEERLPESERIVHEYYQALKKKRNQTMTEYYCHKCNIWFGRDKEACPNCDSNEYVTT